MISGIPFENLNRYRLYPFADNSNLSCCPAAGVPGVCFDLPISAFRMFRFSHVGVVSVSSVRLLSFGREEDGAYKFTFHTCYSDNPEQGFNLDVKIPGNSQSSDGVVSGIYKYRAGRLVDCCTLYLGVALDELESAYASSLPLNSIGSSWSVSCNIEFAPGLVFSMRAPYVISISDDAGNLIYGQDKVKLVAGYNVIIDGIPNSNTILVSALPGAGDGLSNGNSGLSMKFEAPSLKLINGAGADPAGNISVVGGKGVIVSPVVDSRYGVKSFVPGFLNIYTDAAALGDAACPAPEQ